VAHPSVDVRMIVSLPGLAVLLGLIAVGMLFVLLRRPVAVDFSSVIARLETLEKLQERGERGVKEEVARSRGESTEQARALREELQAALTNSNNVLTNSVDRISRVQKEKLDAFSTSLERLIETNHKKAEELRTIVDARLKELQADNGVKLEEMRRTVDEKLQGTLEKRLGESFKQVSDRLEAVHKGLGEMQNLATGVGDLKRVLTNVKARGTWGEVQLGNLLEQVLAPEQFARNVSPTGEGRARVEFAIKLPGRDEIGKAVWLPIDAKFPKEDYERLVEAAEKNDLIAIEQAGKDLEARVKSQARDIQEKYILPPHTTDFGLLYLPTEGLYAEVLRRPGLVDSIQRNQRVVVVGPTTLAALLNSLQMGFRTLAIQRQSSEVWKVLGTVKAEFGRFGEMLDKVKKKIEETGSTIDQAAVRSRAIEKSLRQVETLPAGTPARPLIEESPSELFSLNDRMSGK
jgi:DNA recombination protein RmuC